MASVTGRAFLQEKMVREREVQVTHGGRFLGTIDFLSEWSGKVLSYFIFFLLLVLFFQPLALWLPNVVFQLK